MEDNPPGLAEQQVPVVLQLKPSTITSALVLGLPDLAKPFTVYVTEKDKVAMGVFSRLWGHGTDPWFISQIGWTMFPLGGQDGGQLLWLPYGSGRQPS